MVRFERITVAHAVDLLHNTDRLLSAVHDTIHGEFVYIDEPEADATQKSTHHEPKLYVILEEPSNKRPKVVFRQVCEHHQKNSRLTNTCIQAGDSAILIEYGPALLDFNMRARVHAFETEALRRGIKGVWSFAPCIRSTLVCYAIYHVVVEQKR